MASPATSTSKAGLRNLFAADLDAIGVGQGDSTFIDRALAFAELLTKWNAKIRLVGPSDLTTIVREQLVDAMGFALAVAALDEEAFWDIGAGGGLPGLALAIRFPERRFFMVEPIHKKTAFLQHAAQSLGLANAFTHTGRVAPDGSLEPAYNKAPSQLPRAAFSRATLAPDPWLATARNLVGVGGLVLIAVAETLPPSVANDPTSSAAGTWRWTVPASSAPRALYARRIGM